MEKHTSKVTAVVVTVTVTVTVILIVAVTGSLLRKKPNSVSPVQMQMLWRFWAPQDTSSMRLLWLRQVFLAWLSWP